MAFSAILTLFVLGHKDSRSTGLIGTFTAGANNAVVGIDLIVLEDRKGNLLSLVLDFLWSGVVLLLLLFATTTESEYKMKSRLLLDIVVGKCTSILKLLSGKNQALLIGGDSLLILNLGLDILNGVTGFYLESDGLSCKGLNKDLHLDLKKKILHTIHGLQGVIPFKIKFKVYNLY